MRDDNGSKMSGIDMALRGQRYQWRYVTFSHAAIEDEKTIGCKKSTSEFRHQFSVDYFDGRPCRVLLSLHPIKKKIWNQSNFNLIWFYWRWDLFFCW